MSYYHDNKKLPLDRAFTLNATRFPANWLRLAGAEDKSAQGIEWKDDPALIFKNERFYYNSVDSDGAVVSTPKDLDMLKRGMIADANRAAHQMLSGSDWMVVKQAEVSTGIAAEWSEHRSAIRTEANRQGGQIEEATSIESLMAITANWPVDPDSKLERERHEAGVN
jgi:hypothetical protein